MRRCPTRLQRGRSLLQSLRLGCLRLQLSSLLPSLWLSSLLPRRSLKRPGLSGLHLHLIAYLSIIQASGDRPEAAKEEPAEESEELWFSVVDLFTKFFFSMDDAN